MSTAEEIRERRRLKIQEKLNAKYKGTLERDEDTDNLLDKPTEPLIPTPQTENIQETTLPPSQTQQTTTEPKVSVFDEYKKMRNMERFEELLFKIRTIVLIVYSIISAFTITGNPILGIKISPLPGLLSLEVLFFAISYGWNKAKGTSYFDRKGLDIPLVQNLMGKNMLGYADMASSYIKKLAFVLERVEDVSLYLVFTFLSCEVIDRLHLYNK